jgi:hypothetical protein
VTLIYADVNQANITQLQFKLTKIQCVSFFQVIASMQLQCMYFAFTILYAVLVCVACSQLEKLKANLSDINWKSSTSEGSGAKCETDAQELVSAAQKRLNECVRHHQLIIQYVYINSKIYLFYGLQYVIPWAGNLTKGKSRVSTFELPTCIWIPEICWNRIE